MARGLAARETIKSDGSGAVYANDRGEEIELYDILYFPPEGGKYEDDKKGEVDVPVNGRDKCVAAVQQSDVAQCLLRFLVLYQYAIKAA